MQEENAKPIFELHQKPPKHEEPLSRQLEIKAMHQKRSTYKQSLSGVKDQARN